MKELFADIKLRDFNIDPSGISLCSIKIIPEEFNIGINMPRDDYDIPFEVIQERASSELAKIILSKLKYRKVKNYDDSFDYIFSINDYTILESKEKEQIINNLLNDIKSLENTYNKLQVKYDELYLIAKYNNRPLLQKLKESLLYDKPFTKEIK